MITKETIMEAYLFLRKENQSIPDETLDFIKQVSLEALTKSENLPISDAKASAIEVAKDLAEWSIKYPRGRIYGMSRKKDMDGQLIKLEERAKEILSHLP